MAAKLGNTNSLGNRGGQSFNDRRLAAEVRSLTLNKIKDILEQPIVKMEKGDYELYKAILIKLSGSVLPRLNEHTGEDGERIIIKIAKEVAEKNEINSKPSDNS